jgi:C1A family cysteine protease/PKD repeat protein
MKKAIVFLAIITIYFNLSAQSKPERAPLNPEFIKYMDSFVNGSQKKSTSDGFNTGYVPSPVKFHFNTPDINRESKKSLQVLPSYFNLNDSGWVTPVRDQGPAGACMSFSVMGAIESRWLKLGFGDKTTLNLSEQNMATCHGFELTINQGGNFLMADAYLSRLSGPVTEASDPYNPIASASCKSGGLVSPAYSPVAIYLPKDINIIKKTLMDYGAVCADIYVGTYTQYYNTINKTYFYNGTSPTDHAVLIIGWDDNKTVTGKAYKPVNKGAWIVKNSWGTSWGDKGYFYVSYEDSRFLSSCAFFPERVEIADIDTLLMYDRLGVTNSTGFRNEVAYGLGRFESSQQLFINKIATSALASGSFIDIDIYSEFTGDSVLNGLIASSHNNFCKFPGNYSFDISAIVQGTFYVKIKYYTPGFNYPLPIEVKIDGWGKPYAIPDIEPSGTFWMSSDEKKWMPLGNDIKDSEADLSIRVFANRSVALNPFFTSNKTTSCLGGDVVFTDDSNGSINSYLWNFGSGASPATANTAGPHTVSYSTPGYKDISLTITGPSGTKTLSKKSYVEVVTSLEIFLPYSEKILVSGKSIPIIAYGADTYSWSPAEGLNTTTGPIVIASPTDTITYTVAGTMGTCTGEASIKLNIVESPANDDVCNAVEIFTAGKIYNNIYATVEDGEPAPPEGDCEAALTWCVEGGLQNSVWFWFIAPPGGKVSFTTTEMDTQMALYKAEICDSILLSGYEMIAANDDNKWDQTKFAAALDMVSVIPGEKYYLQIDGSAGGDEGEFWLIYWEAPVSVAGVSSETDLKLFPNPNNGTFRYEYNSVKNENLKIRVINSSGQEVYLQDIKNAPLSLKQDVSLKKVNAGIYIFELTSGQQVLRKSFVIH